MRRWLLILLMLIYPFQVTLAMADGCCLATPAGITHHADDDGGASVQPVLSVDDGAGAAGDPHCPACVFAHSSCIPHQTTLYPSAPERLATAPLADLSPASLLAGRPERPQWNAARRAH
ncbi:hypothetical protein [Massilia sp. YMA4]|uniref:DUF2946 domain-containing protein n=1 Tax=[Empedobacter] haloabium TaxID=592317 RepID=A0ABZ1UVP2_9BURK|nr:hypothetical protein [Massilia sp. YMA4]AXA90812.1 hypothetical protein DPH57_06300 [Massilia sp. YMA4]